MAGSQSDVFGMLPRLWTHLHDLSQGAIETQLLGREVATEEEKLRLFFKPSASGCVHVFPELSIRVVEEVVPTGLAFTLPAQAKEPSACEAFSLTPQQFHSRLLEFAGSQSSGEVQRVEHTDPASPLLLDVRNYYEHRLGRFESSICPPLRSFKGLPSWVEQHKHALQGRDIYMYCTGGVRCEKAGRWMQEFLSADTADTDATRVFMLKGGIDRYFDWIAEEQQKKGDASVSSLFQGRNYVFDARQSVGLQDLLPAATTESVSCISQCEFCTVPCSVYTKCASLNCHLLLLVCPECQLRHTTPLGIPCCHDCTLMSNTISANIVAWLQDQGRPCPAVVDADCIQRENVPKWVTKRHRLCSCEELRRANLSYTRSRP
jgi:predicted sulfurtransferase